MWIAVEVHQDYEHDHNFFDVDFNAADRRQSYSRAKSLKELKGKLHKSFKNYLRLLCGHFLRIQRRTIYLVHQTTKKYLLDTRKETLFTPAYYLRQFGSDIQAPTEFELREMRKQKSLALDGQQKWEQT
jgi:hypothetical protein